jgi:hypothetical protein
MAPVRGLRPAWLAVSGGFDARVSLLCLRVRSIGEAARLEVSGERTGFRPFRNAR